SFTRAQRHEQAVRSPFTRAQRHEQAVRSPFTRAQRREQVVRSRSLFMTTLAGALLAGAFLVQVGPAQQPAKGKAEPKAKGIPPGDWPMYSRDLTSARYSPLKEINSGNVANLKVAWTYRPPAPPTPPDNGKGGAGKGKGGGGGLSAEVTPVVVNGVM